MTETICAVALDAATYAIDKLYSYRVPDELREQVQIGTRVLVPFGFGNKRAEGVVLGFRKDTGEYRLKPVVEALDEQPVLTPEQLKLAAWMRERLYCTYFDCVRAMLPAGLWFKRNETYTLVSDAGLDALHGARARRARCCGCSIRPGRRFRSRKSANASEKARAARSTRLPGRESSPITATRYRKPATRPKKCWRSTWQAARR